jgi:hypothetical protein
VLLTGTGVPARHHEDVEILWWWLPPALVTAAAMVWVSWLGRARDVGPDRSDAAQERFAAAIRRELPQQAQVRRTRPVERSTGIAVRPSQATPHRSSRPAARRDDDGRRSA